MALRNELSSVEINEVLECRKDISEKMLKSLKIDEDEWGVKFIRLDLQDIGFEDSMKRAMSNS